MFLPEFINPWNCLSNKNIKTSFVMLMRWIQNTVKNWDSLLGKPTLQSEDWNIQSHSTDFREGRGTGSWINSQWPDDLINYACVMKPPRRTGKDGIQRAFVMMNTWRFGESSTTSSHIICLMHVAHQAVLGLQPFFIINWWSAEWNVPLSSVNESNKLIKPKEGVFGTSDLTAS